MKRKIIAILLIIILFGLSSYASAQNDIQIKKENTDPQSQGIGHFEWGIIIGTYDIESYNDKGFLVLENEDNHKTIRIIGLEWNYDDGVIPTLEFSSVKTHKVVIVEFHGFHIKGRVFGYGTKNIDYS